MRILSMIVLAVGLLYMPGCGPSVPPELQAPPAEPMTEANTEAAGPGGMAEAADPF